MKTDNLSFSFVAAIVPAGVIVALASPSSQPTPAASPVAQAASYDQIDSSADASHVAPDLSVSE